MVRCHFGPNHLARPVACAPAACGAMDSEAGALDPAGALLQCLVWCALLERCACELPGVVRLSSSALGAAVPPGVVVLSGRLLRVGAGLAQVQCGCGAGAGRWRSSGMEAAELVLGRGAGTQRSGSA